MTTETQKTAGARLQAERGNLAPKIRFVGKLKHLTNHLLIRHYATNKLLAAG